MVLYLRGATSDSVIKMEVITSPLDDMQNKTT
jgi:hypothetical protein